MDQAHFIYGLEDVDIQTADIWQTQERLKPVCPLHTDDPIIEHCTAPGSLHIVHYYHYGALGITS